MISEEKKLQITDNIIKSKIFLKSPKSSALLRYLVKANIEGSFLKEDIIDFEFFGSKSSFDKTNPRVRVNIYNLRKKLDTYYNTIGANNEWKICIDKGQYSVRFEKQLAVKKSITNLKFQQVFPYLLLLAFALLYVLDKYKASPSILWEQFYTNNKPNTLIIGDAFGIAGTTITGSNGWTRDYTINNTKDYFNFIEDKPELKKNTSPAQYNYITGMGAHASHDLANLFSKQNSDFDIRFSSNTSIADLKKGNTIYVGPIRNENKFISLFNNSNPYFKLNNNSLSFSNHKVLPKKNFKTNNSGFDYDIAIVSRIPGPQNTEQFIFFSNHDIGVKATIEYFTNADSLKVFNKKYLKGKSHFTAVYKAFGKDRTNLAIETIMVVPF